MGTLLWWSSRLGREAPAPVVRMAQLVRSSVPRDRGEMAGAIVVEGCLKLVDTHRFDVDPFCTKVPAQ